MSEAQAQEVAPETEVAEVAEKPKVEKDTKNDVTRPKAGTKTGFVWETADRLSNELGAPVPRKDVMEVCEAQGMNKSTVATQYARWRKYNGLVGSLPKVVVEEASAEEEGADATEPEAGIE